MLRLLYITGGVLKSTYIGPNVEIRTEKGTKLKGVKTVETRKETNEEMVQRHFENGLFPDLPWSDWMTCPEQFQDVPFELLDVDWSKREVTRSNEEPRSPLGQISQKNFRTILSKRGLYKLIPRILASIPDEEGREQAEIAWEFADYFDPEDPVTLSLVEIFVTHPESPLDEDGFWDMWREAMKL